MKNLWLGLRATLFYICYVMITVVVCFIFPVFIFFLPFNIRYHVLSSWNYGVVFCARWICGIKYTITGLENIPKDGPYVILAKHQSQWETFLLLLLFKPVSIILKKELLKIPGFGLGLSMMKPIAIDRSNPKQAIKQIKNEGMKRLLEDKMPVMIFPEGTRIPVGEAGKYARGGANLAIDAKVPVIFVSHNAGYCWPSDEFIKHPGTVEVVISKPVNPEGMTAKELTDMAQQWVESHIKTPR